MSYPSQDESNEISELHEKLADLQSQILNIPVTTTRENVESGQNSTPGTNPGSRVSLKDAKPTDLGAISGNFEIDFHKINDRNLVASVDANTTITFINIPFLLFLNLRLYIKSTDPIITIDGTIVSGVGSIPLVDTVLNDLLDITLRSDDQINIIVGTVKKNDKTEEAPSIPQNVISSNHSNNSVDIEWDPSAEGTLPLTYDVEYSLSSAETNGVPDSPITDPTTKNLTDTIVTVSGLIAGTPYYFWVRAKNDVGASAYFGGLQTITDGSYSAGDVSFSLVALSFNKIQASYTQPTGKALRFTLIRDFGGGILETVVDDDVPTPTTTKTYDDTSLPPNTQRDYIFQVRNEFGTLISVILASATTDDLPLPVITLTAVGIRLQFDLTVPADINLVDLQWDTDITFASPTTVTRAKPLPTSSPAPITYQTGHLSLLTLYYVRARFKKNDAVGAYSSTQSIVTSSLLPPSKPQLTVQSHFTGDLYVRVVFDDNDSRNETAVIQYRQDAFDDWHAFPGNLLSRDFPPADDEHAAEHRISVHITGGWSPGDNIDVAAYTVNASGDSGYEIDNINIDP